MNSKCIVITTIHRQTEAIKIFKNKKDWDLIIVGDLKTPHNDYENDPQLIYLHPEYQKKQYREYSECLGWNLSPRRNIGFIEAYRRGYEIISMTDDDNIPNSDWGKNIILGRLTTILQYSFEDNTVFDPLFVTNHSHLWHRGFPLEKVATRKIREIKKIESTFYIQANLWNGNPDIDALERMIFPHENTEFDVKEFYTSDCTYAPFDSQNTFIHRDFLPFYMLLPEIERVDDIWGSYLLQMETGKKNIICYGPPTVCQTRNHHNLMDDFDREIYGTRHCMEFLTKGKSFLSKSTLACFELYQKEFKK